LAARLGRLRPVASARQPENLSRKGRGTGGALRRAGQHPATAALDRLPARPRSDRVLARPAEPPARAPPIRAHAGRLDQYAALPVTDALAARARLTRSAALASIATALFLAALKLWAVWQTGSTA